MPSSKSFTLLLLLYCLVSTATGKVYYITPNQESLCKWSNEYQCLTLSQFSGNAIQYLNSSVSLVLLPGTHIFDAKLKLADVHKFEMISESNSNGTTIFCGKSSRFSLNNINSVLISDLGFRGCKLSVSDVTNKLEIANSTFTGNEDGGTALWVSHSNVSILKSSFISNMVGSRHHITVPPMYSPTLLQEKVKRGHSIETDTLLVGGAIYAGEGSKINIRDSNFIGNIADLGGAIFAEQGSQIIISHSTFRGKRLCNDTPDSSSYGTAGCKSATTKSNSDASLPATNNAPLNYGGAIFLHNSSLNANKCTFIENSALTGGVLFAYRSNVYLSGCQFNNNTASYRHNKMLNSLTNDDDYTNGNAIHGRGGAFYTLHSNLILDMSQFTDNNAHNCGGAIHSESGSVVLNRCNFSHNIAGKHGGAVWANSSYLQVDDTLFSHNVADDTGGAIHVYGLGSNAPESTQTFDYPADSMGRQITTVVRESTFIENNASYGGSLYSHSPLAIIIMTSNFSANSAKENGGAVMLEQGAAMVNSCSFTHNKAYNGGGISSRNGSTLTVQNSTFSFNNVIKNAGGISGECNSVLIRTCTFKNHTAKWGGAVVAYENSTITMEDCMFTHNVAKWGGALASYKGIMIVNRSILMFQEGLILGGAAYAHDSMLTIDASKMSHNTGKDGGAIAGELDAKLSIHNSEFHINEAQYYGSVIHWTKGTINTYGQVTLRMNTADKAVVYLYETIAHFNGNTTFTQNYGSLYTVNSQVTFTGMTIFDNSSSDTLSKPPSRIKRTKTNDVSKPEGGALTITFESTITFNGQCVITNNDARYGGGLIVTESTIIFYGDTLIAKNEANDSGGGAYLYQSEMKCKMDCTLQIRDNTAHEKGGGFYALSSLIKVTNPQSMIHFIENTARIGGGICLEMDSKIYVLKAGKISTSATVFTANVATKSGGAIHVIDRPQSCTSMNALPYITNECFLQTIEQHNSVPSYKITNSINSLIQNNMMSSANSTNFSGNIAGSGPAVYGGLITSCTVHQSNAAHSHVHTESDYSQTAVAVVNGVSYIRNISNINLANVSSDPIQVCVCRNGTPDCSYKSCPIKIMRGGSFNITVAAVDQANHPVPATVYSSFTSTENNLTKHSFSVDQETDSCTILTFSGIGSARSNDTLILHVEGPCKDTELSKQRIEINYFSCSECPIGFEPLTTSVRCECTCDSTLEPFVTRCNPLTGNLKRESNFWLTIINESNSTGPDYLFYEYCPMDYCLPPITELNLNIQNGSDAQCSLNRTGLLCGSCPPDFSLSLGSSRCLKCQDNWPVMFVTITLTGILAGIALCIIILIVNLTVAVGTINGVIFYANILAASYSTFLPKSQPNVASIFISLLNLELGVDACYLKGMDAYTKTWLQFAFPLYVFILVLVIIKISQHSLRFSKLIGRKNPVATLSTLILLSYSKILHTTISALSFATLHYPNGSIRRVWRLDASVEYLNGKHIVLFVTSMIVLLTGIVYTTVLFSWQWILRAQTWRALKWTGRAKVNLFIETYHAPFNSKHRYWTGFLLLVRSVVYLVAATNTSGNPRIILASTAFAVGCILVWKASIGLRIYKSWIIDTMETLLYFNILTLVTFSWLLLDTDREQAPLIYISVLITFGAFLLVVGYHIFQVSKQVCRKCKKLPEMHNTAVVLHVDDNMALATNGGGDEGTYRFQDIIELMEVDDVKNSTTAAGKTGYQMTRKASLLKQEAQSISKLPKQHQ